MPDAGLHNPDRMGHETHRVKADTPLLDARSNINGPKKDNGMPTRHKPLTQIEHGIHVSTEWRANERNVGQRWSRVRCWTRVLKL